METNSNRHVIKNNDMHTKADLMTMSTPPHLLSTALANDVANDAGDEESRPPRKYYNHRSKFVYFGRSIVRNLRHIYLSYQHREELVFFFSFLGLF